MTLPHILYGDMTYPDQAVETAAYRGRATVLMPGVAAVADVADADAAAADGLLMFRSWLTSADLDRMPRLRCVVRMGVGYDRVDRVACAARGITVCNVPDYGTMEVADHAIALTLALRRGIALHLDAQRRATPADWVQIESPLMRRLGSQTFGIVGLGRIGTAAALRARAFGFRVIFYDPALPNGADRALGIERAAELGELLAQSDVLSLHTPLTPATRGMIGAAELSLLPDGAIVINTARGPILDLEALADALRSGRLAGAGLDVIPREPPADDPPDLLAAYRAREPWLEGRLIVTPHVAFHSPEAWADIRQKSAETMAAALLDGRPQNVIRPAEP